MIELSLRQTHQAFANGVNATVAHAPHLARAHASIAISAGYLDEPSPWAGLAHLLEHVLTTAPLAACGNKSLLMWFAQHQGTLNARTDDHVTDIHFTIPLDLLEQAGLMVATQVAIPHMPLSVIHREVAAIDAEWQARQSSASMRKLAAFSALADPQHIGAGCRHGNAQTLGQALSRLHDALSAFHHHHYHAGRVSITLVSPWGIGPMLALVQRMALLFKPSTEGGEALAMTSRWGSRREVDIPAAYGAPQGMALLWPLPSHLSYRQFFALTHLADTVNQGLLIDQFPSTISDYCATAAPSGATDTFHLQLDGYLDTTQREALAMVLSKRLNSLLAAQPHQDSSLWQPPTHSEALAPAWFSHARHQALARRFSATSSAYTFASCRARFLVPRVSSPSKSLSAETHPVRVTSVQRWCGHYGVYDDFPSLADTAWAACFIPKAMITLGPLVKKRLAQQGVTVHQKSLAQGSWVMTVGSSAVARMGVLLASARLTTSAPAHGLLAQQLLQRLVSLPDTPALWLSQADGSDELERALESLTRQSWGEDAALSKEATSDTIPASTAIMRTLSLLGTPAQRWLLAQAEQCHSAAFFQQARHEHSLGYVAAVRRGDGAPCSLGYVIQTTGNPTAANTKLADITDRLWQRFDDALSPVALPPETPLAALMTQWQSLLAGATQPLHRLPLDRSALNEQITSSGSQGGWQTHWLDSHGRYRVSS